MADNTTAYFGQLTCTDKVNFSKSRNRCVQPSLYKRDSNYLDVKLNFSRRWEQRFSTGTKSSMREAHFIHFNMRLAKQVFYAAKNFGREKYLRPIQTLTMSKAMDEQLKLAHKVVDNVDHGKRNICVTRRQYNVDKPHSSWAEVQIFAENEERET